MGTLLLASSGGHLVELRFLARRMELEQPLTWITFDTPQTRSLLADDDVRFVPYAGTRDLVGTGRAAYAMRPIIKAQNFSVAVSTGASIALVGLPLAARYGAASHYVESATRLDGPSLTGRLLRPFPSVRKYTQHEAWADDRWQYRGSIFDNFRAVEAQRPRPVSKLVVSLGMHPKYEFRRLVERLAALVPRNVEVLWQVGATDCSGLPITSAKDVPAAELAAAIREADAVVTHAGMGSALTCMDACKRPIFVPRSKRYDEHVDDHQHSMARALHDLGLVTAIEVGDLSWEAIAEASQWTIASVDEPREFVFAA